MRHRRQPSPSTRFAQSGALEIAYEVVGEGPPVLLIMGLGASRQLWKPQIDGLREHFTLIPFDNRGVGDSSVPRKPFTLEDMARDAKAVLDAVGIERAHVVGVSLGGMIAQHLALLFPEVVERLVLCVTTPGARYALPSVDVLETLLINRGRSPRQIARDNLRLLFTPETLVAQPHIEREFVELTLANLAPLRGFVLQAAATVSHDTLARLDRIRHPTLVLHADRDELVPLKNGELLHLHLPNSRFVILEGSAHGCFMDRAADANGVIRRFLDGDDDPRWFAAEGFRI
ncbi:MAG: alpha/beta fold hydrolase [Myxococcales bacterium]|nr:alpha/beta fold hydrolase [Myxococcales bacterium]